MHIAIGIIGDFDLTKISHIQTNQCIDDIGRKLQCDITKEWVPSSDMHSSNINVLKKYSALFGAPGGYKSESGAIKAIQYARENKLPYLGT